MRVTGEPVTLALRHAFHLAHGVSETRHNVFVRIGSGLGEAAAVPYYEETQSSILETLRSVDLDGLDDPFLIDDVLRRFPESASATRAGVDMALHDLCGQLTGLPVHRMLGLNPENIPPSSMTIAIDEPEEMAKRARETDFPILKIKLGSSDDRPRLEAIRSATNATLRADVNGGWSRETALALLPVLEELGVELVEQPLPVGDVEGLRRLMQERRRPRLFADESVRTSAHILAHAGAVDGVVIKLAKSGGIRAALRQINVARELGMDVMLSCMIESSVGATAAAQIAPLARYVDLDGPTLIGNDPMRGLRYHAGRLLLSDRPGFGLEPNEPPS